MGITEYIGGLRRYFCGTHGEGSQTLDAGGENPQFDRPVHTLHTMIIVNAALRDDLHVLGESKKPKKVKNRPSGKFLFNFPTHYRQSLPPMAASEAILCFRFLFLFLAGSCVSSKVPSMMFVKFSSDPPGSISFVLTAAISAWSPCASL